MIVSRAEGVLRLVEQVEHGRVAGELAAGWGNDTYESVAPRLSVRAAAACHDEGWRALDARVLFNEVERRPLHFLEIDAGEHIRLYRQGLQRVSLQDVYAGVLVGMHWTGLYRGRWSAPGGQARVGRSEEGRRRQDRVVRSEQRRWIDAKEQAWSEPEARSAFETRLWHNYELLQLWDLLSLYLSVMPQKPGPAEPAATWGPQLRELEHTPQTVMLPAVAPAPGVPGIPITASVRSFGEVTLDPFPFRAAVDIEVEHTVVPDRGWTKAEAARRVRTTPSSATSWRLVPPATEAR